MNSYYYNHGISTERWLDLLKDSRVFKDPDIDLMKALYDCEGCRQKASDLAVKLGKKSHSPLNSQIGNLGKRIINKFPDVKYPIRENGKIRYWNIPFWGEDAEKGRFFWILRPELKEAIEKYLGEDTEILEDLEELYITHRELSKTQRKAEVQNRIGQGIFRNDLIKYWQGMCAITGCKITKVLRASHIKPWRDSSNTERLDLYNGLLLIPNLDSAFDMGYISFDSDGKIICSGSITENDMNKLGIHSEMRLRKIENNHIKYFKYHRQHIFKR